MRRKHLANGFDRLFCPALLNIADGSISQDDSENNSCIDEMAEACGDDRSAEKHINQDIMEMGHEPEDGAASCGRGQAIGSVLRKALINFLLAETVVRCTKGGNDPLRRNGMVDGRTSFTVFHFCCSQQRLIWRGNESNARPFPNWAAKLTEDSGVVEYKTQPAQTSAVAAKIPDSVRALLIWIKFACISARRNSAEKH
jgi:hypothetical protein